ncbi:MAG: MATE family efflux transporter, partial [Boseongicola sp. SB0670_bin_30]|nr:MATE family efflux transporter [Boseongicola sp. SB0670_bin_30]
ILLQWPIFQGGFLISPASPAVEEAANTYMSVRIWSAPAAIALYGINGWLIASERTRAVLALQVWMNGLNIVLDVVFVLGFGWSVAGVAFATFLAEWSGLALGLWLCRDAMQRPFWNDLPRILSRARLFRMAVIHRDILLRSLFIESIFVSFLFFGARFGDVPLAANQILLQFVHLTAHALDGFAIAAETLVGNAMGARDRARLRRGAVLTSAWGAGVMVVFSVAVWAFGPWVIELMTTSEEVRIAARALLPWMIAAPVLGIAAWMLDGIFVGAMRTGDMRNMTAVSAAIYFVSVWILSGHGNDGLWMALLISLVARGVTLGFRYPALERAGG